MADPVRILHLSDVHFDKQTIWKAREVVDSVGEEIQKLCHGGLIPDVVVFSGDLAWAGKKAEYELGKSWIESQIFANLPGTFDRANFFLISGNHDIDRNQVSAPVKEVEKLLRNGSAQEVMKILTGQDAGMILRRHSQFIKLANMYRSPSEKLTKYPWWAAQRTIRGIDFGFAGLASSLISYGSDANDRTNLVISQYQLNEVFVGLKNVRYRVALIHHPLDYLTGTELKAVDARIRKECILMLRGHLHDQRSELRMTPGDSLLELAAGSTFSDADYPNAFQLIELDFEKSETRVHYRVWQGVEWIPDRNRKGAEHGFATLPGLPDISKSRNNARPVTSAKKKTRSEPPPEQTMWTREFVALPLERKAADKLAKLQEGVRKHLYRMLRREQNKLKDQQIRSNIFFPNYRDAHDGYTFFLYMPEEFRINMNHPPEWDLRFGPGVGATGVTFVNGTRNVVRRLSRQQGEWDSLYRLTPEHKRMIHKDLSWLVSLPLRDPTTQQPLAVLNLDGLDFRFKEGLLSQLAASLVVEILAAEVLVAEQPRERLNLILEPAK